MPRRPRVLRLRIGRIVNLSQIVVIAILTIIIGNHG
ncbi:hypothetical protein SAMN05519105_3816 [Rhodobacter sp. 24-YEA-8]|nr:hypothetical protein SAMN05519105_3816 [Rhodobacter sp. 24-YEA-8]